jgi:hypothetical protein
MSGSTSPHRGRRAVMLLDFDVSGVIFIVPIGSARQDDELARKICRYLW